MKAKKAAKPRPAPHREGFGGALFLFLFAIIGYFTFQSAQPHTQAAKSCAFATKWPWQERADFWNGQRNAEYEIYRAASGKAAGLRRQISEASYVPAPTLSAILRETEAQQGRAGTCMRFAEMMARDGDEDAVAQALGQ